ncbi:MAG: T9SS type A sorting domain-containing protein [Bacteroidetes bacterium]|nr:T9SS type A sorting domain-containing protein [Bacteroidota bacterium]
MVNKSVNIISRLSFLLQLFFLLANNHAYSQGWAKSFLGTTADNDNSYCIARGASGDIYIGGGFRTTVDSDPNGGVSNLTVPASGSGAQGGFFGRYTSAGVISWAKQITGSTTTSPVQQTIVQGIVVDAAESNIYVTGVFLGTNVNFNPGGSALMTSNSTTRDIFIASYTTAGVYNWAYRIGAANSDYGYGIAIDASNNIYVTGTFNGTMDFNPNGTGGAKNLTSNSSQDIFVASYTSAGVWRWAFGIGGTSSNEYGYKVKVDAAASNIFICGSFTGTNVDFDPSGANAYLTSQGGTNQDGFVAKYTTAAGAYVWANKIGAGAATPNIVEAMGISRDASDNIYVAGYFYASTIIAPALTRIGSRDCFYAKYNSAGTLQWAKNIGTASNLVAGQDVYTDGSNVNVVGYYSNTIDFDPGAGVENGTCAGTTCLFFTQYSAADGSFLCKGTVDGGVGNIEYANAVTGGGGTTNFYITGWFAGTNVDFDATTGSMLLTSQGGGGNSDVFFAKYANNTGGAGCKIGPLPIELLSFTANCKNTNVKINWQTASEQNNDYFTIERAAQGQNGKMEDWNVVGTVKGAGNSTTVQNYEFVDAEISSQYSIPNTQYYYRLKQTDYNGKYEYFGPISVNCNSEHVINILPTVSSGYFTVVGKGKADINVYTLLGQKVFSIKDESLPFVVDLTVNSTGTYLIQVVISEKVINQKLIIQK